MQSGDGSFRAGYKSWRWLFALVSDGVASLQGQNREHQNRDDYGPLSFGASHGHTDALNVRLSPAACRRGRSARVTLSFSFSFVVVSGLWFCICRFCRATEGKELLFDFKVGNSRSFLHISWIQRAYQIVLQGFIFAWAREAAWSLAYSLENLISQRLGDAAEEWKNFQSWRIIRLRFLAGSRVFTTDWSKT